MLRHPRFLRHAGRIALSPARVAHDHPDRFGFFATLARPDVGGALEESCYALDTLRTAGVILRADTHGGNLGTPEQEPLFAADFLLDTTRAVCRLVSNGVLRHHPNPRIVLADDGKFLPYASHRIAAVIRVDTRDRLLEARIGNVLR